MNVLHFFGRIANRRVNGIWFCHAFIFGEKRINAGRLLHIQNSIPRPPTVIEGTFQLGPGSYQPHRIHDRFLHHWSQADHRSGPASDDARLKAEVGISVLARQGRSWRRLSHLVDLAILDDSSSANTSTTPYSTSAATRSTIADIGTDHGLLAMGLALTGRFDKVIGVDVSDLALKNGAKALLKQVQNLKNVHNRQKSNSSTRFTTNEYQNALVGMPELPIEFRLGNGLTSLDKGEANCICIAGMGVNRMIEILQSTTVEGLADGKKSSDLARIGCQHLILQPTNSRPQHLMKLYDQLQRYGWRLTDERIEKLSSRWYITASFRKSILDTYVSTRKENSNPTLWDLPGSKLQDALGNESKPLRNVFVEYVQFHKEWIHHDAMRSNQTLDANEERWLECFGQTKPKHSNN